MKWLKLAAGAVFAAVLIGVVVLVAVQFQRISECLASPFSFIDCLFPDGEMEQGEACGLDFECKGWSLTGRIACCGGGCVTKGFPTQTCSALLKGEGRPCGAADGTIWPLSGCDVSAGICCKGKCAKACPRAQGEGCTLDPDCAGWSLTGRIACCGSKCVTKKFATQTCSAFLKGEGQPCDAADGTIWPFSGCDISAGICRKGRCSTK